MRVCGVCGSTRCSEAWVCDDCGNRPETVNGFFAFAPSLAAENPGFREAYFAELAALEAGNFWFRARNELITWAMTRYFPDLRSFLEVGCGTGYVLRGLRDVFPSADLAGSEIFSAGLAFAARRVPSAQLYQMDARRIPFRDHFDAIGAFDVIEHIDDDGAVLDEINRALRPGGGLLLTVPQHPALWSPQDVHAHHVRRYTLAGLRQRLQAARFDIVRTTSFMSLLLPMMVASRWRMRGSRPDPAFDVMDELRQPRAVNLALGAAMSIERALIRGGVSFPAGGSLLVVARKAGRAEAAA